VDDMELIKVLEASKMKAAEIQVGNCLLTHLSPPSPGLPPPLPTCSRPAPTSPYLPYACPITLRLCLLLFASPPRSNTPPTAPPGQGQDCRADREGH
jgi:hypothetical protein